MYLFTLSAKTVQLKLALNGIAMNDSIGSQATLEHHRTSHSERVSSFTELKVFKPVPNSDVCNIMSSRWVLRWKLIDGHRAVKAR